MSLQFHQAVENMDVWSANSADVSFVITFASPSGPGFHGRLGFLASWRPLYSSPRAVEVTGSPFNTFADAEAACNKMLEELQVAGSGPASGKQGGTAIRELDVGAALVPPEPTECDGALNSKPELLATSARRW